MSVIVCKCCWREWPVSEEDPDSTLSAALGHVELAHHVPAEDSQFSLQLEVSQ